MVESIKKKQFIKERGVFEPEFANLLKNGWESGEYKNVKQLKDVMMDRLQKSSANNANRYKIGQTIERIKDYRDAMFVVYNHILAHPSEGLKAPSNPKYN